MTRLRAFNTINFKKRLDDTRFVPDVRYMWIDEDGRVVRAEPFTDFAKALTWFQGWEARMIGLRRRLDQAEENGRDWQVDNYKKDIEMMSKTGKPPVELRRVVLQATVHEISPAERRIIQDAEALARRIERA